MIKALETNLLADLDKEMLQLADKYGYIGIAVSCLDPNVKESIYWAKRNVDFICGEPGENGGRDENGSVAIWKIAEILDKQYENLSGKRLAAGCGNSHQYQLLGSHPLSKVSYEKVNCVWYVKNIENVTKELSNKYGI